MLARCEPKLAIETKASAGFSFWSRIPHGACVVVIDENRPAPAVGGVEDADEGCPLDGGGPSQDTLPKPTRISDDSDAHAREIEK